MPADPKLRFEWEGEGHLPLNFTYYYYDEDLNDTLMIEFDYKLDYKNILFRPNDRRYRIGRGEQGVLLVRPYTDVICKHWRFKTLKERQSIITKNI